MVMFTARGYRALFVVFVGVEIPTTVIAQARPTAAPRQVRDAAGVRAELAAVLLQSKKYDDAAKEYRGLLARDPSSFEYRLGLARALAWSGKAREAEVELRALRARNQQITTVDTLLRTVREAMKPTSPEARVWVAERPSYAPYRLAFARALAAEGQGRLAAAHYDTLLLGSSLGRLPDAIVLKREQLSVLLATGAVAPGIARLRDILRSEPTDTALRHRLAVLLVEEKRPDEARVHYDTLIAAAPSAELLVERGQLRFDMNDRAGAEADLVASLPLGSTVDGYLLLGDIYRERGSRLTALAMYRRALAKSVEEDDERPAIAAAIARVSREDRPTPLAPVAGDDPGWRAIADGVNDNLGVTFIASTLRGALALGSSASVGVAGLHHYLAENSPDRSMTLTALGGEASLAGGYGYGPFYVRGAVSGGSLQMKGGRSITLGAATVSAWMNAWQLTASVATGPAYPSLLTTTAVRPFPNDDEEDVLIDRSVTGTLGGPIGRADVGLSAQLTRLSDDNSRVSLQGFLRYPLTSGIAAVYSASSVKFAHRTTQYWDPFSYFAQGVGLELASEQMHGLSFAARAIPGVARSRELPPVVNRPPGSRARRSQPVNLSAFQVAASGELVWRDPRWEGTAGLNFGRGRAGDYQRLGATLGVRVLP
jgi:tetratricopeptide (TPR) repeat protein